jgi:hypothetical protein
MKIMTRIFSALSILILFFMTSCASTKVTGEWKDPNMTAKQYKDILVMGIAKQPQNRKSYEDEFVKQLKAKGVTAVSSHTLIRHEDIWDKDTIVQTLENNAFDGVIITQVQNSKERHKYQNYNNNMYSYYNRSYAIAPYYRRGNTTYQQQFGFESNLYDAKTEELVFSLSSDTYAQDNIHKRLCSYIENVVKKLVQNNLL